MKQQGTVVALIMIFAAVGVFTFLVGTGMIKPFALAGEGRCSNCEGVSVLSVDSDISFISNIADLQKMNYLIALTMGGSQQIAGTLTGSQFKVEGATPSSDFPLKIEGKNENEELVYPFLSTGQVVPTLSIQQVKKDCTAFWESLSCTSGNYQINYPDASCNILTRQKNLKADCITIQHAATIATIDNPTINSLATFIITISKGSADVKLSSAGAAKTGASFPAASIYFGTELVGTIKHEGGLMTGTTWSDPGTYRGLYWFGYDPSVKGWRVVGEDALRNYQNAYSAAISDIENKKGISGGVSQQGVPYMTDSMISTYSSLVSKMNEEFKKIQVDVTIGSTPGTKTLSGSESAGAVTYTSTGNILMGIYTLKLKADWIGIVLTAGKPEIQKPIPKITFNSGTPASFKFDVKNVGTGTDTFAAQLEGCTQEGANPERAVGVGGTASFVLPVAATVVETKECIVKVCSVNLPSNCDTAVTSYTAEQPKKCLIENELNAEGALGYQCRSGDWAPIKQCGFLAQVKGNEIVCLKGGTVPIAGAEEGKEVTDVPGGLPFRPGAIQECRPGDWLCGISQKLGGIGKWFEDFISGISGARGILGFIPALGTLIGIIIIVWLIGFIRKAARGY